MRDFLAENVPFSVENPELCINTRKYPDFDFTINQLELVGKIPEDKQYPPNTADKLLEALGIEIYIGLPQSPYIGLDTYSSP
ncbi:MAG: hypothetical protein SP4CHLAM5_04050 [Chlamydiia bacterium]|nr:hypothetical protein [Chlamydiia bacterium]MCH9618278.1 hypothetical protein [Chlamydiia bacterium]MCH9624151.1 hypothetical protein [Chlamydiia bacterium]